jgi:Tfp pilus assembly protein PilF
MRKFLFGSLVFLVFAGLALAADEWQVKLEEAKVDLDQGQFSNADAILQDLITKKPNQTEVNYYLGLTKLAEGQHESAENYLKKAHSLAPDDDTITLDLVYVYILAKQPKDAIQMLDPVLKKAPNNSKALYERGLAAFIDNDFKTADTYFSKARPGMSGKAAEIDYYLGACARSEGKAEAARSYFDQSIKEAKGGPWEKKAEEAKESLPKQNKFFVTADFAYQYDTNIIAVPNDSALPKEISHMADSRELIWLQAGYRPLIRDNGQIGIEYHLYNNWQDSQDAMNLQIHQGLVNGFYDFKLGKMPARIFGEYMYQYAGLGTGYEYYSTTHRVGPAFYLVENNKTVTEVHYYFQDEYFHDPGKDALNRDNNANQVLAGQHFYVAGNKVDLGVFARYQNSEARGLDWDLNRYGGRAIAKLIKWKNLSAWAYFDYDYHDYYRSNYMGLERLDQVYTMSGEVSYNIWKKNLAVFAGANYQDHHSNVDVFNYNRVIYSAGIRAAY